ncbi:histidine kinase [Cohnella kolymensis]|uniref:histidine kinase n=1 Tax=Cohnella kolymensis TaxID=1590652 RepID=A0ABR5A8S0_9BACL|nr:DcuS/MalK family sensor histidine kinase [Cohnella kolymensis]KIL37466.1 histidine kinase [Cohnella kolymensis]
MRLNNRFFSLQTTIIMLVCGIFILALFVTDFLISGRIAATVQNNKIEKTSDIARMVANSPVVMEGLLDKEKEGAIQPFANRIKEVTNVDFITVMDMQGIRKSHPDPGKVGKRFVGGDEGRVLQGFEHVSTATGTLGVSLRSFVPVYAADGRQVGAVSVGILLVNVKQAIADSRMIIFAGIGVGGLVGLLGAWLLARKIKKILFGLEPHEIARLLQERSAMLQSTKEGILAVDINGTITLVNAEAVRLFQQAGLEGDPIGKSVKQFLPNSPMETLLQKGEVVLDQEYDLGVSTWLINRVPISIAGKTAGAIATFRDKTEITSMAEQLTGVQMYVEALRSQAHEFMNKLHVILGMVHMGYHDQLTNYVNQIAGHQQNEVGFIVRKIRNAALAGFILGKLSYAREVDAELTLSGDSVLPEPDNPEVIHELITIVGNLIDNALHAVQGCARKAVDVCFDYENMGLTIIVSDTGPGIPDHHKSHLFTKGFSTKGDNRGLGLFLVQRSLKRLGGTLDFTSKPEQGTRFTVTIPYAGKEEDDD